MIEWKSLPDTSTPLSAANLNSMLYYSAGETQTISAWAGGGYLTTGAKAISFSVPLPRNVDKITTATITGGQFWIRHSGGGYLVNNQSFANLDLSSATCTKSQNSIRIDLEFKTAFSGVNNNSPVGVQLSNLNLKFS